MTWFLWWTLPCSKPKGNIPVNDEPQSGSLEVWSFLFAVPPPCLDTVPVFLNWIYWVDDISAGMWLAEMPAHVSIILQWNSFIFTSQLSQQTWSKMNYVFFQFQNTALRNLELVTILVLHASTLLTDLKGRQHWSSTSCDQPARTARDLWFCVISDLVCILHQLLS